MSSESADTLSPTGRALFCVQCGASVSGPYCGRCGSKIPVLPEPESPQAQWLLSADASRPAPPAIALPVWRIIIPFGIACIISAATLAFPLLALVGALAIFAVLITDAVRDARRRSTADETR